MIEPAKEYNFIGDAFHKSRSKSLKKEIRALRAKCFAGIFPFIPHLFAPVVSVIYDRLQKAKTGLTKMSYPLIYIKTDASQLVTNQAAASTDRRHLILKLQASSGRQARVLYVLANGTVE